MQLPYSDELEIQYLSRLFDNTSECYKFFWFQAIVTEYHEGLVRKLIEKITVYDNHFTVEFKSGLETEVTM